MMYKNAKKVDIVKGDEKVVEAACDEKIIIVEDEKIRENIIDVMKLTAMVCAEMKPKLNPNNTNTQLQLQIVPPKQQQVAAA